MYALGNPIGYSKTFTPGIVSAIRKDEKPYEIQLTAAISPGSSGGALLNINGELIGITSSSVPKGQNLNFAIPVEKFMQIPIADLNNLEQKELIRQMKNMKNIPLCRKKHDVTKI
ncbi:MAG: trypsin-like peptidase domain-containing protein [Ignavibacteria bacterium]|nr:trypsin-like peptidase domain-containing protein [Ignavibacteria bacterium]